MILVAQVHKSVLAVLLVLFMVKGCDRNIFGSTPPPPFCLYIYIVLSIYIYIYYLVILNLLFLLLLLLLNRDVRSLSDLNYDHPRPVFPAGPQPRPSPPSVPCRTSTTTIHAQCSLPDLNREYPRQVFPAGPHEICQIECQKICQMEC